MSPCVQAASVVSQAFALRRSIELDAWQPPSRRLDLMRLTLDDAVMTKLYEAPVHALDEGFVPYARPRESKRKRHCWPWLLAAPPALCAAAIAAVYVATPFDSAAYKACQTGVCAGFAAPTWAIVRGLTPASAYQANGTYNAMTLGNQTALCLSHFDPGAYAQVNASYPIEVRVTYNRVLTPQGDDTFASRRPCGSTQKHQNAARSRARGWGIPSAIILECLVFCLSPRKPAQKSITWLDGHMRWLISPRLAALSRDIRHMSRADQRLLEAELSSILHDMLGDCVARADKDGVEHLLALGVSPTAHNPPRISALRLSFAHRTDAITTLLLKHTPRLTPNDLNHAAQAADLPNLLVMLSQIHGHLRATPDALQAFYAKLSPLLLFEICASQTPSRTLIKQLLGILGPAATSFLTARDAQGRTALHIAAFWQNASLAKALVKAGADIEARDAFGKTPEDLAHEGLDLPSAIVT